MDFIKLKGRFKKTQFHLKKKSKHISSNVQFYFLKGSKSKSTTWSRCELHSVKEDHKLINGDYLTKWTQVSTCSILYCEWHFENEVQHSYMDHRFPTCNHITSHNTMSCHCQLKMSSRLVSEVNTAPQTRNTLFRTTNSKMDDWKSKICTTRANK